LSSLGFGNELTIGQSCYGSSGKRSRANIHALFRIERKGEQERWVGGGWDKVDDGQRLLLWHGSRSTNFAGILKQGLRIAPPEGPYLLLVALVNSLDLWMSHSAPVTGYEFGKGVYLVMYTIFIQVSLDDEADRCSISDACYQCKLHTLPVRAL
jgi:hypothetical protein